MPAAILDQVQRSIADPDVVELLTKNQADPDNYPPGRNAAVAVCCGGSKPAPFENILLVYT
ncbi:hypothetical protein [Adhaeribacter aerolatus]|uniref:hypothetical protein n=1 Tax=Adhaeribacter aerolatus TaxID=670289 RepID=UPI0011BE1F1C|nr:hypothetical protein [Adhaeribacter aerolatus]